MACTARDGDGDAAELPVLTINEPFVDPMRRIVADPSPALSLRLIDYFVVNYSRKKHVWWLLGPDIPFDVNSHYQSQLSAMGKRLFDPFRRYERIRLQHDDAEGEQTSFETTLGQTNFFRWAHDHRVLQYIATHQDLIYKDMKETLAAAALKRATTASTKQPLCSPDTLPFQQGVAVSATAASKVPKSLDLLSNIHHVTASTDCSL